MQNWQDRTLRLLGKLAVSRLNKSHVLVVGLGGVGSFAAEALARASVGQLTIMDPDSIEPSNINRQLFALSSTVAKPKAQVAEFRIKDINPDIKLQAIEDRYQSASIHLQDFSYVIDACDDLDAKLKLAIDCQELGTPIISAMGTAGLIDARFEIMDIFKTKECPLARKFRRMLRDANVKSLDCLVATHRVTNQVSDFSSANGSIPSISYIPGAAGLMMAGYVVQRLIANNEEI